jgi:ArsR family transcriptional regulator, lead/cadmium/zinc/bismuth-responsive transcriptional repressor
VTTIGPSVDGLAQRNVADGVLSTALAELVATNFRALSDPTRVRIIHALSLGELCNRDLADVLGLTESAVSHQMKDLRLMNLVTAERRGRTVRYRLNDSHVRHIFEDALKHVQEAPGGDEG